MPVYSANRAGGASDQLQMKQKKGSKWVSNYRFLFWRKKPKPNIESAYSDKIQTAVSGTKQTTTTGVNKIPHRKHINKLIFEFVEG